MNRLKEIFSIILKMDLLNIDDNVDARISGISDIE